MCGEKKESRRHSVVLALFAKCRGTSGVVGKSQLRILYAILRARLKLPRSLVIFSCNCRMA
jgi:hypothetical protein